MSIPIVSEAVSQAKNLYGNLRWVSRNINDPANPFRYVRGSLVQAMSPGELMRRRKVARDLAGNLEPAVAQAVADMEEEGMVKVTHLMDPALLQELMAYFENVVVPRREHIGAVKHRPFFNHMRTDDDLAPNGVAVRFAMQEKIVNLVTAYMGKAPFLRNLSFLESTPTGKKDWEQSQLWHLDYFYKLRTPSLWVYLSDVEREPQGPFTYLPAKASLKVKNDWIPRRILDEEIEQAGLSKDVRQIYAPKLTCFMVDNSRIYHLGSRMGEGERRSVYIAHYVDPVDEKAWLKADGSKSEQMRLLVERG